MDKINELKIKIFDIIREQAKLNEQVATLEQSKLATLRELNVAEENAKEK